jgi:hypothetical protein
MYKCIVFGITLEKLNGPGYGTNVHIFILGSSNILSFTNIPLSMWEELWWQSAWWIVSNFQVQTGITLKKLNGPGYTTNVHIFILGSRNILSFTNISLSMWEELWWQSAWWIVSKFLSPKKHNRGKPQWTGISYQCAHLHIGILQCTKFHELLINHVGEFAMTKLVRG